MRVGGDAELLQEVTGAPGHPLLLSARSPQAQERRADVATQPGLCPDHHVLEDREPGAEPHTLQGAGDPEPGQVMGVVVLEQ